MVKCYQLELWNLTGIIDGVSLLTYRKMESGPKSFVLFCFCFCFFYKISHSSSKLSFGSSWHGWTVLSFTFKVFSLFFPFNQVGSKAALWIERVRVIAPEYLMTQQWASAEKREVTEWLYFFYYCFVFSRAFFMKTQPPPKIIMFLTKLTKWNN